MGTASKFDVVNKIGAFIGGVIAPGAITSLNALAGNAAQLFEVPFEKPASIIGKQTIGAMQSGAYFGTVGQIDYIVERMLGELRLDTSTCKVVGTGGLIETIAQDSRYIKTVHPELTLEGIFLIANANIA
jgi:type III pantothenate kinase